MENLILFAGVIFIVFGFMQIILFFKIWGMTNDVKRLVRRFSADNEDDFNDSLRRAYLKGDMYSVQDILNDNLISALLCNRKENDELDNVDRYRFVDAIVSKREKFYKQLGIEMPENIIKLKDGDPDIFSKIDLSPKELGGLR